MTKPVRTGARTPPFNRALGFANVTAPPPFSFEKVVLRYFPLRANYSRLARFCENYLNGAPEFAYFRPALPFVMLTVVDYGKMSLEAGNLGWTSQNELLFSLPLEWYEPDEHGELVFKDFAMVSPFIFVDNEASQVEGREVYGWPKVQGWFTPGVNPWVRHPLNRRQLLSLATNVYDPAVSKGEAVARELVAIEEEAPPTFSVFPPQPDNILNPWNSIPKAIRGFTTTLGLLGEYLLAPTLRGYSDLDRESRPQVLAKLAASVQSFTGALHANTINLKQIRDAARPQEFCYQALTNAKMEFTQFHRGGMLGDLALLRGDSSGGFRIRMHEFHNQPIVDTLGLEVVDRVDGEVPMVTLLPVLPFWQELDMKYLRAENLCWRTNSREDGWRNAGHEGARPVEGLDMSDDSGAEALAGTAGDMDARFLYNTMGANGYQVATGPFWFPAATLRVLPLPAERATLQTFVDAYLNMDGAPYSYEVWGDYVYMVIGTYDDMTSLSANIGNWARRRVEFAVPLRCYRNVPGQKPTLASTGYISPFTFIEGDVGTNTAREVFGWSAMSADIYSPENSFLGVQGPFADVKPLVSVDADIIGAFNLDEKSRRRTILEVVNGDDVFWNDHLTWKHIAATWGERVKANVAGMAKSAVDNAAAFDVLRAQAAEVLANGLPINQLSLKQFRDAQDANDACYQAIVSSPFTIDRIWDIREIEDRTHVRIPCFPALPIVEKLGLIVKTRLLVNGAAVDVVQPMRPFYLRADITMGLAENACVRTGMDWHVPVANSPGYFEATCETGVAANLALQLDGDERRLKQASLLARQQEGWKSLPRAQAAASVEHLQLQPQMVVSAMLSRQWGQADPPRERPDLLPDFVMRRDSVGPVDPNAGASSTLFPEVTGTYWSPDARAAMAGHASGVEPAFEHRQAWTPPADMSVEDRAILLKAMLEDMGVSPEVLLDAPAIARVIEMSRSEHATQGPAAAPDKPASSD